MQYSTSGNKIDVVGNIKTIKDTKDIQTAIDSVVGSGSKEVVLSIKESIAMTSSLIGFLLKIIKKDGVSVNVHIRNENLYELLSDLELLDIFKVKRI